MSKEEKLGNIKELKKVGSKGLMIYFDLAEQKARKLKKGTKVDIADIVVMKK